MQSNAAEITRMLGEVRNGNQAASGELIDAVYLEMRSMARKFFSSERPDHTLQPTALVNEAYLRLFSNARVEWHDRVHFFAVAARQMRRILIDHGREFRAQKRGAGLKVALDDAIHALPAEGYQFEEVNELLDRLQRKDPQAAQVVELKFFAGMTDEEVAVDLSCSISTVRRHWIFAKAWLGSQLSESAQQRS